VSDSKHEVGRSARRNTTTRESVVVRFVVSIVFKFFTSTNAHVRLRLKIDFHLDANTTAYQFSAIQSRAVEDVSPRVSYR